MDELKELKKMLDTHRQENPNMKRFPNNFWPRVIQLAKNIPCEKIAAYLNINLGNLNKKIKDASSDDFPIEKLAPQQFLEIPIEASKSKGKQIVLSLPHNITIRIDL